MFDFYHAIGRRKAASTEMSSTQSEKPSARFHIAALLPEPETVVSCLECAVAMAKTEGQSEVEVIHVGFDPRKAIAAAEELDIQFLRERFEGTAASRLEKVRTAFDAWIAAKSPSCALNWKNDEGDVGDNVAKEADRADLLVIGRPVHLDARDALRSALFSARRLVLVAPARPSGGDRVVGRHVAVGWKPTDHARRAVEACSRWLRKAACVSVISIDKPGATPYDKSAKQIFADLGITCDVRTIPRDGRAVGVQLLAEAERAGADSLVIGAYKHGALWEAVLGGVTRDVLVNMTLPVFMAH